MRRKVWIATVAAGVVIIIAGSATGWHFYAKRTKLAAEARALQSRAEQGDAEAEAKLGTAYVRGRGVPRDYDAALRWYRKSVQHGSADGEVGMGAAYYYGYGVTTDFTGALSWYRKAADQGSAAGEAGLGYLYEHGDGVARDYAEALRWYRKAADSGDARVAADLGGMYYYGHGVSVDYSEALRWYRMGADHGDPGAEYDLGYMYFYGRGVPQNRAEANRWFAKAADAGNQDAEKWLSCPLKTSIKFALMAEFALGTLLLSLAPTRLSYLAAPRIEWNRNRLATVTAGLFCLTHVGLNWYGYTHFLLRRVGVPLNAFTWLHWVVDSMMFAALANMVRVAFSEEQTKSAVESIATS